METSWRNQAETLGLCEDTVRSARVRTVLQYLANQPTQKFTSTHLRQALNPTAPEASYRRDLRQFTQRSGSWLVCDTGHQTRVTTYQLLPELVPYSENFKHFLGQLSVGTYLTARTEVFVGLL